MTPPDSQPEKPLMGDQREQPFAVTGGREFVIQPRGPFSWNAALDVLAGFPPLQHHSSSSSERVRLTFPLDGDFTPVAVALWDDNGDVRGEVVGTENIEAVAAQVARIFSLDYDGSDYPAVGDRNPEIGRLMQAFPGLRPPCYTSPYETAAWGIISQRINMRQAARIQDRLIQEHGHRLSVAGEDVTCFPTPDRLLDLENFPGLSAEKVERLRAVAQAALEGVLDAERLRALGNDGAIQELRAIRGIGPFWAATIYLRGCGIVDVFPDEPQAIEALGRVHGLSQTPDMDEVQRLTEAYRPFRMWVCFLLRVAAGRGLIPGAGGHIRA